MPGHPTVSPDLFRAACGRFATGVAVATVRDSAGERWGLTVNSFSSVSLDPPLVLFSIDLAATSHAVFTGADAFAINILEAGQRAVSDRFSVVKDTDRFAGVDLLPGSPEDPPILAGCLATLVCDREQTVRAGDHTILIGRVRHIGLEVAPEGAPDIQPLAYFKGGYAALK